MLLAAMAFLGLFARAQSADENVSPTGTSVVELLLPPGATTRLEEQDYGTQRRLIINDLTPNALRRLKLTVTFADGKAVTRDLDLRAGWHVRVAVAHPDALPIETWVGNGSEVLAIALTPDNRYLATSSSGKSAVLWDLAQGRVIRSFLGHTNRVSAIAISADGRLLVTGSADLTACLWDATTGEKLQTLKGHFGEVTGVAISPDARYVLTGSADKTAILWNADTGAIVHTLEGHTKEITAVAYSPDGKRVITSSMDRSSILWNAETGQQEFPLKGHTDWIMAVQYSQDGTRIVTSGNDNRAILWESATGKKLYQTRPNHDSDVLGLALSSDKSIIVTSGRDQYSCVWDVQGQKRLRILYGHQNEITCNAISRDARLLFTGARESIVKIWDLATGDEIANLISGDDGQSWAVTSPGGLFDASEGGRALVHYRFAEKLPASSLDQFFSSLYQPGLLPAILRGERPQPAAPLEQIAPPKLRIIAPRGRRSETRDVRVLVDVEDQASGQSELTVYHNDAHVSPRFEKHADGKIVHYAFALPLVAGDNSIRMAAASASGNWESRPAEMNISYRPPFERKGKLFVLAIGVSRNADPTLDLKHPAQDARALTELFQARSAPIYDQIVATTITDALATTANVLESLKDVVAQTSPEDALVVFLAGRGRLRNLGLQFVPYDMPPVTERSQPSSVGLSLEEFSACLGQARALLRALVLDTCELPSPGEPRSSQQALALRGTIERVSRTHGLRVIVSSCPSEKSSDKLGHGVLTYALLAGANALDSGPLEDVAVRIRPREKSLDLVDWFQYASFHIPQMAEEFLGEPQSVERSTQTGRFPILSPNK